MFNFFNSIAGKIAIGVSTLLISIAGFIAPSKNTPTTPSSATTSAVSVAAESPSTTEIKTISISQTKQPVVKITTATTNSPTPKPATPTPSVGAAVNNPAAACLPTKNDWHTFIVGKGNAGSKLNSLLDSYNQQTYGTNRPTDVIAAAKYDYGRMQAYKDSFTSQVSGVQNAVNAIPKPPTGTDADLQIIKDAYLKGVSDLQSAWDLAFQADKYIAEKTGGIGTNDLDVVLGLLGDSITNYKKVSVDVANTNSVVAKLQGNLSSIQPNGCMYTFVGTGTNVWTTTPDEKAFVQAQPSVNYDQYAKEQTQATISLSTNLPIEINDNGTVKTVMYLTCATNGGSNTIPVQRINQNSVQVAVNRSSAPMAKCVFVYSADGDSFSGPTASLPW